MERSTAGTKKRSPDGLTVALANSLQGALLPDAVDELPKEPNLLVSTTPL